MAMLPKHTAVALRRSVAEGGDEVGFVTSIRGETTLTGVRVGENESGVTFVDVGTGTETIRVVSNDDLRITGC